MDDHKVDLNKYNIIKRVVCASCLTVGISDPDCICCYSAQYKTIELEFQQCKCCGYI